MHEYTINKCGEMLETDRATVARALRSIPPDAGTSRRPLYRLATAARALEAHRARANGSDGGSSEAGLALERARLAREQTAAVSFKNAVAQGEYVRVALVQAQLTAVFATFRERCLSIPGKVADACAMRSRPEIEEIIRAEICEALDELHDPSNDRPRDGAAGANDAAA